MVKINSISQAYFPSFPASPSYHNPPLKGEPPFIPFRSHFYYFLSFVPSIQSSLESYWFYLQKRSQIHLLTLLPLPYSRPPSTLALKYCYCLLTDLPAFSLCLLPFYSLHSSKYRLKMWILLCHSLAWNSSNDFLIHLEKNPNALSWPVRTYVIHSCLSKNTPELFSFTCSVSSRQKNLP